MENEAFVGKTERYAEICRNNRMESVYSEGYGFSRAVENPQHEQGMSGVPSKKRCLRSSQKNRFQKAFSLAVFGFTVFVLGSHLTSSSCSASGFALYTSGAAELAMCNAVIAHTEGPASNFWNPALLSELVGNHVEIGTIPLKISADFKSDATGEKDSMERNTWFPSTLFLSYKINDRFIAGFGVNNTFGLGTEWPDDWEGKYIATNSELEAFNINANLAWKASDKLTLACGFNVLLGDATFEQKIDPLLLNPFGPDGYSKIEADGEGYGYNLGILYKISEELAFGMSFRSGIKLELEGDVKWSQAGISIVDTGIKADLDLPARLFAGVSFKPSESITLEISGKWEDWSSYKQLKLKADQPIFLGSSISIIPKGWKDVYSFNAGIKYSIDPTLSVSAGYCREANPIPSHTFEPAIPGSDKNWFSFGVQKSFGGVRIALSYLYNKYEKRNKNNNVVGYSISGITANGKYEQDIHMAGLSVSYKF